MNYYIHQTENGLKVGTEKPEPQAKPMESYFDMENYFIDAEGDEQALKDHEASLMDVENAHISQHPIEGYDEVTILKPVYQIVPIGQQVEIKKTGEKTCKIIKLI